jgi:hypothetical protein
VEADGGAAGVEEQGAAAGVDEQGGAAGVEEEGGTVRLEGAPPCFLPCCWSVGRAGGTCARAGADARVWPNVVAYILCECDLSHWIGDGRLKYVGPFGLNGPFSFLWLFEPFLQILHLFFF